MAQNQVHHGWFKLTFPVFRPIYSHWLTYPHLSMDDDWMVYSGKFHDNMDDDWEILVGDIPTPQKNDGLRQLG